MTHQNFRIILALAVWGFIPGVVAADPAPDKGGYTLVHPTPPAQLRELTTDRPDRTESAYTVDAGHLQIEMDLASYTYDHAGGPDSDGWGFALSNFRIGLLNQLEVQVIVETFLLQREHAPDGTIERSGFGDVTLRGKLNLWGNDGGKTAMAVLPYIKFPTNQDDLGNDEIEGGVILPFALDLGNGWGLGMQTGVDILHDDAGGYHGDWINSITLSKDITEKLGAYVEFFSAVNPGNSDDWEGTVDFGITFALAENIQIDGGVNIGVTDAAADFNPFVGLTVRF